MKEQTIFDASSSKTLKYFYLDIDNRGYLRFWIEDVHDYDYQGASYDVSSLPANKWYHIVGIWRYKSSPATQLYFNGNLVAQDTRAPDNIPDFYSGYIGKSRGNYGSPWKFKGLIDEVLIFHKALTEEEIKDLYENYPHTTQTGKVYVRKYADREPIVNNVTFSSEGETIVYFGSEESFTPERRDIITKKGSFGLQILKDRIYAFINTSDEYREISYPIGLGTTYFVAISYDGRRLILYINGKVVNYTYIKGYTVANTNNLIIDFKGIIDELRIYNISLDPNRVKQEYDRTLEKEISYYIEPGTCNTRSTTIFVKLPLLINQTIYMYYCNPNAYSASNGYSTFDFYDDFNDGIIDKSLWVSSKGTWIENNGYIYYSGGADSGIARLMSKNIPLTDFVLEAYIKTRSGTDVGVIINSNGDISTTYSYGYYVGFGSSGSKLIIGRCDGDSWGGYLSTVSLTSPTNWELIRIIRKSDGSIKVETPRGSIDAYESTYNYQRIGLAAWYSFDNSAYFDWIRVRKYVEPWPTYSLGREKTC